MKRIILTFFLLVMIVGVITFTIYTTNEKNKEIINNQNKEQTNTAVQKSKVENAIPDKNYTKLEITSDKIQSLYQKTRVRREIAEVPDYYTNEKFTNDSIITITLENDVKKIENKIYDESLGDYVNFYEYDLEDFSNKAKELWGENVSYDLEKYKGVTHCEGYSYNPESKKLNLNFTTGCGLEKEILSELVLAYETNTKLVLIEKSLYVRFMEKEEEQKGIYNNAKEKKMISAFNAEEVEKILDNKEYSTHLLKQYDESATYYSYTFEKKNNDTYYLKEFKQFTI